MRMGGWPAWLLLGVGLILAASPARADILAADLSQDVVKISSSFKGTEIILFGALIRDLGALDMTTERSDIIVVVRGPPEHISVRRKGRVGPIWMNVDQVTFEAAPSFYFVGSTVPLETLEPAGLLARQEIGLANVKLIPREDGLPDAEANQFRAALIGLRRDFQTPYRDHVPLYTEMVDPPQCRVTSDTGCFFRFSGSTLFSARLPIPADVPIGKLNVSIYLARNGRIDPTVGQSWTLDVSRTGLDGWLYKHAMANPFLYGLGSIMLALAAGATASAIARK